MFRYRTTGEWRIILFEKKPELRETGFEPAKAQGHQLLKLAHLTTLALPRKQRVEKVTRRLKRYAHEDIVKINAVQTDHLARRISPQ